MNRQTPRVDLMALFALLLLLNLPLCGTGDPFFFGFTAERVRAGEWWRLLTHPFTHVSWYHLLLDGTAFLLLYHGLCETRWVRRLVYLLASAAGSLLVSWLGDPRLGEVGLCGLSGVAHGLLAVSGLEMISSGEARLRRAGWFSLALVVSKGAIEALTGEVFFRF